MCGITGYYQRNGGFDLNKLRIMSGALKHRGPDADGFFNDEHCGLGHRRLSILDLSDDANQPMDSHDGRYTMIFNGEIYNFRELREKHKIIAKTTGDTEVILEMFIQLGPDFANELNGMFALAIYDKQEKAIWLFRDRAGIKPLFIHRFDGGFAFASEIKAFTAVESIKQTLSLDRTAINDFLYLGYIPNDRTIYNEIKKFPTGSWMRMDLNDESTHAFWTLEDRIPKQRINPDASTIDRIDELLNESIRYRMISDVPLGTFLSGGIDSSLVSAIAQKNSNHTIKTFSIGFKEDKFDETKYAAAVAKSIGSDHHEFIMSYEEALAGIEDMMVSYDEPYSDPSAIPLMYLSKKTREHVTVALSGDGGDELFFGYGTYNWARRMSSGLLPAASPMIHAALNVSPKNRHRRRAGTFAKHSKGRLRSHIFSHEQYCFSEREVNKLTGSGLGFDESLVNESKFRSPMERQSIFDFKNYMRDELLVKVDRASMAYSLEVRVPILDHRLVEFAYSIDPSAKTPNGVLKHWLKELAYRYMPKELFDRPKSGFSVPIRVWLRNELREMLETYTSRERIEDTGLFNYEMVDRIKTEYLGGRTYQFKRLWLILLIQKWIADNGIKVA